MGCEERRKYNGSRMGEFRGSIIEVVQILKDKM
jgi:hypothetical protein